MQSVKVCDLTTPVRFDINTGCDTPVNVGVMLVSGGLSETPVLPATREDVVSDFTVSKGLTFGGLTADVSHFINPCESSGACDNGELTSTCLVLWEAIYVQSINAAGTPIELPNLSDPGVGADFDVDIVWKRISRLPFWGIGLIANCQLAISNQNVADHIKVKSRRRLNERQALMYGFSMTLGGDGVNDCIYQLHTDAWFRIAGKRTTR